jgi:ADP-ribose pyrophosphatase YjhB (NUDIX family)
VREAVLLRSHGAGADRVGRTWGLLGGSRRSGESARPAALREASQIIELAPGDVEPVWWLDQAHRDGLYTAVAARPGHPGWVARPVVGVESEAVAWVGLRQVGQLALQAGLEATWPRIAPRLEARLRLVIDVANVMGSVNDGWYRDRLAAARRWRERLIPLTEGVPGRAVGWPEFDGFYPRLILVVEGQAGPLAAEAPGRAERTAVSGPGSLSVVRAPRDGDHRIVEEVRAGIGDGDIVVVATADRALKEEVGLVGGSTIGPGALKRLLG